jgi:hypothetical protein
MTDSKITFKSLLIFLVLMWLGMWIGTMITKYIPGISDPTLASIVSFIIVMVPGYILYKKLGTKLGEV